MISSYMHSFMEYAQSRTDAPKDFHMIAALTTLAASMGNSCWADGRGRDIYPNLWSLIVGPSGIGKSVPLDISQRLFVQAGLNHRISSESFSQEGFFDELSNQPNKFIVLQEFSGFMAMIGREYNNGLTAFLTEIFDVPLEYTRKLAPKGSFGGAPKSDGVFKFQKPCVSILGATAPDWFSEQFKVNNLRSGFLVRFLYCPRSSSEGYVPDPGPPNLALEAELANWLRRVSQMKGRFDFYKVNGIFNEWDQGNRIKLRGVTEDFRGMYSRAGVFAKKIAMLVHVSHDPNTMVITESDMKMAMGYIDRTHKEAELYLSSRVAIDKDDNKRMRTLEFIRACEPVGISRSELLRKTRMDTVELERVLKTLTDSERVIREASKTSGRDITYYRINPEHE